MLSIEVDYHQTISELQALDLEKAASEEIECLLRKFGVVGFFGLNVSEGQFIVRARPNDVILSDGSVQHYYYRDEISYVKSVSPSSGFGRASVAGQPIFYGCINDDDENFCQLISIFESARFEDVADGESKDIRQVTMGKWRVKKSFHATAFVQHGDFHSSRDSLRNMHDFFVEFARRDPENSEKHILYAQFIAGQFARQVPDGEDYLYKISAIQTKILMELGIDAVVYPSVKGEGKGFNIAIHPRIVENGFIELEKVAVWQVIRQNMRVHVHPYLYCDSFHDDGKFIYRDPGMWTPQPYLKLSLEG
jgi:hypothetical protein